MSPEKEDMTPMESLDVITSMIRQAKGNIRKSSFYFLLWGWTIAIANLGVFILIRFTTASNPFVCFSVTIPAAIISLVYGMRQEKSNVAPTLLDNITKWLWIGFGITCFTLAFFGSKINWQINPVIITMCAAPTFVSGIMLRFRPLMYGGIAFWMLGILSFLTPVEIQFLLASAAVILGYLIPGYLLRKSEV